MKSITESINDNTVNESKRIIFKDFAEMRAVLEEYLREAAGVEEEYENTSLKAMLDDIKLFMENRE